MLMRLLPLKTLSLVILLGCGGLFPAFAQPEDLLTNVNQVSALMGSNTRTMSSARLTGQVLGIDRVHSAFALGDQTGLLWLSVENLPDQVQQGSDVLVEGTLTVGKGEAFLGKHSIVEGEYYTDESDQSGRMYLAAGTHPLELLYHQATQRAILDLTYQGPGIATGKMPASAFWQSDSNAPTGFAQGLHYDCYKMYSTEYPDFKKRIPDITGTAQVPFGRFNTSTSERDADTG
ncbi:MAG TPA: hypothetical protein VH255_09065, partial [Verrucomicrobiae bacterium]|nr:hypothetical protein [Verrucomicrobiae bacterium]